MRSFSLLVCFAAAQLFAGEATTKQTKARPPQPSQQQVDRIRQSLMSQIAAWDGGENAMRAPTPAEASTLAAQTQKSEATPVKLKNGGYALRTDVGNLSFAVATVGDDGSVKISHGSGPALPKEARHAK